MGLILFIFNHPFLGCDVCGNRASTSVLLLLLLQATQTLTFTKSLQKNKKMMKRDEK
jgi:hypothetical protein